METRELLKKRFIELGKKAYNGGYYTFTDFLGLSEISVLEEAKRDLYGIKYEKFGGCAGCERVMVRFGNPEELGYEGIFPISILKIEPVSQKFADSLTHRDFLGALLNLGIERSVLGDIVIRDNVGYVFIKEDMCEYVSSELHRIKHTEVKLSIAESVPEGKLFKTERVRLQISGERIDAVVAKLFSLSREDAKILFEKSLIYTNGRECTNPSYAPKAKDVISVRGHGRFIYLGYESLSKKGKLNIEVDLYV